jgi:hypothetical protein
MSTAAAKAPTFVAKLKSREAVAEGTMAFFSGRPAGFAFTAVQFIDMNFLSPPQTDADRNMITFSSSSAPQENSHLRHKLRIDLRLPRHILTESGVGYRLIGGSMNCILCFWRFRARPNSGESVHGHGFANPGVNRGPDCRPIPT